MNKVSIQLKLDGHSFSIVGLDDLKSTPATVLTVEVLTPRTMLVPQALLNKEGMNEIMELNGMAPKHHEMVVCDTHSDQQVAALMAVPRAAVEQIERRVESPLVFTSPLMTPLCATEPTAWIGFYNSLLYIKVYEDRLRFAEVISAPTQTDVAFFMDRLGREFPLQHFLLFVSGDESKQFGKMLSKRFKKIICE